MFSFASLFIFLLVFFFLVTITAGISVASGLFVPMMVIGATMGRALGQGLQTIFNDGKIKRFSFFSQNFSQSYKTKDSIDPSIYALVGSAAMMSGFSRITISLCVILIELTESKNLFFSSFTNLTFIVFRYPISIAYYGSSDDSEMAQRFLL